MINNPCEHNKISARSSLNVYSMKNCRVISQLNECPGHTRFCKVLVDGGFWKDCLYF